MPHAHPPQHLLHAPAPAAHGLHNTTSRTANHQLHPIATAPQLQTNPSAESQQIRPLHSSIAPRSPALASAPPSRQLLSQIYKPQITTPELRVAHSFKQHQLLPAAFANNRLSSPSALVVVCTPGLDGITDSDKIREGCSLGLLQLDLAADRTPSYDIHQQSETLSLPNFVENFGFEFDIDFVVLAQFGIELPSCFGVDSFYRPNWAEEVVVDYMKVAEN
ncbi:hypothetical protein Taro_020997 [Colocasia esculenta]|uniref:Uncharacterized protein n=1 Tax=Colocasia esculenta TaxID=4460 RepID=A0A843V6W5_COLES|nr:hypothetical protein [Colocasia esculenta]